MADLSDVEAALAGIVNAAAYPNGANNSSVTGDKIAVERGWPKSPQIEKDLKAGVVTVSVYSQPGVERNTTRYFKDWQTLPIQPSAPLLTLAVSGRSVTVGGTIQAGDVAAVKVGTTKAYAVASSGSLSSVATALAALAAVDFAGTAAVGPVITFPAGPPLYTAVGGNGAASIMELRQQLRGWQITVWAPTPGQRDAVGKAIDTAFAGIERVLLPDQTNAHLIYESSRVSDANQLQQEYRRDLFYSVEYSTTITNIDQIITAIVTSLVDSNGFTFATSVN